MSRRGKNRESIAPSLFPFLAVLLCTMGALVLILMLEVGQSQATAREATVAKQEQTEEIEAQIELVKAALEKKRSHQQLELEKKRLTLQSFEDQIQQSLDQFQTLARTSELIDNQQIEVESDSERTAEAISALEKQLADAAAKLKHKLEKPTGEKPVFAIIPYEGQNGTHRRPVYLECTALGIVLQPEGVLISMRDLRPPYGPGNPLDAALRTVRNRYAPASGALTSGAYPLLVVRPSGIQAYALARLAMAGWDDQFGYELVDDEMDLVYPEGEPGLRQEIEQSLSMARNRQAALVLAMPGKYRRYVDELNSEPYEPLRDGGDGFGDSNSSSNSTANGGQASGNSASSFGDGSESLVDAGQPASQGGLVFDNSAVTGSGVLQRGNGSIGDSASPRADLGVPTTVGGNSSGRTFSAGKLVASPMGGPAGTFGDMLQQAQSKSKLDSSAAISTTGGGQGTEVGDSASTHASATDRAADETNNRRDTSPHGSGQPGGTGPGGGQAAHAGMAGINAPAQPNASSPSVDGQPSPQNTPSVSMDLQPQQKSESIAKRRGRNWASTGQSSQSTAVVRSIRMACFRDKWIVYPEAKSSSNPITISLNAQPQASAEQLAEAIADRVDRWGAALAGGYWKPVLIVDVAYGGQSQFQKLVQLLEGSGVDIQRSAASP